MHHQQLQFRLESLILHHQLFFYWMHFIDVLEVVDDGEMEVDL